MEEHNDRFEVCREHPGQYLDQVSTKIRATSGSIYSPLGHASRGREQPVDRAPRTAPTPMAHPSPDLGGVQICLVRQFGRLFCPTLFRNASFPAVIFAAVSRSYRVENVSRLREIRTVIAQSLQNLPVAIVIDQTHFVPRTNEEAKLPGPLQGLHAARRKNAASVRLSDWICSTSCLDCTSDLR